MDDSRIEPRAGLGATPAITAATSVVVSPHQVSTSLGDEAVILGADAGQYFGLNEVGARIWELVQEPIQVSKIRDTLCAEYEVPAEQCERDVIELLADLSARGLLHVRSDESAS